jgi:hypothetical protein
MKINFSGFNSHVSVANVSQFENQNDNIRFHKYAKKDERLIPIRVADKVMSGHTDLLYLKTQIKLNMRIML